MRNEPVWEWSAIAEAIGTDDRADAALANLLKRADRYRGDERVDEARQAIELAVEGLRLCETSADPMPVSRDAFTRTVAAFAERLERLVEPH